MILFSEGRGGFSHCRLLSAEPRAKLRCLLGGASGEVFQTWRKLSSLSLCHCKTWTWGPERGMGKVLGGHTPPRMTRELMVERALHMGLALRDSVPVL